MMQMGSGYLVDLLRKKSEEGELDQSMVQFMMRIRDEIRNRVDREDTNYYFNKIEEFRLE